MDVFGHLPFDKKQRIINAAMEVFANHGYRKASVSDIAHTAGISKAMVFTYFGSKRGCYEYMCDEMLRVSLEEFDGVRERIFSVTDYFDRLSLYLTLKIDILNRYPSFLSFTRSMYAERDGEALPIINRIFSEAYHLREMLSTADIDSSKFKCSDDAARAGRIVGWLSQGCTDAWSRGGHESFESVFEDFNACLIALKKHYYKEECL